MPFKSEAQRRWMHENRPDLAPEFEAATPKGAKLPDRVQKKPPSPKHLSKAQPKHQHLSKRSSHRPQGR